jgi:dynein heavy chain, axonemal
MVQTSLTQFNNLYGESIAASPKASVPQRRIANIIDELTYRVYVYVQRGLFEQHKLTFALMLANKIQTFSGKVLRETIHC